MRKLLILAPLFLCSCKGGYLDTVCEGRIDKDLCYRQEAARSACSTLAANVPHNKENDAAIAQCFLTASADFINSPPQPSQAQKVGQ